MTDERRRWQEQYASAFLCDLGTVPVNDANMQLVVQFARDAMAFADANPTPAHPDVKEALDTAESLVLEAACKTGDKDAILDALHAAHDALAASKQVVARLQAVEKVVALGRRWAVTGDIMDHIAFKEMKALLAAYDEIRKEAHDGV